MAACGGGGGGGGNGPTCASSVVSVSIEPGAATVVAGTPQPFVATITGAANTAVTWSIQEGASGGTMSDTGVYTAPSATGTYHVVATSQADSCGTATAEVTVESAPLVTVSISPEGPVSVEVQWSYTFLATVTGTANAVVTWSVQAGGAGGRINPVTGVYTAPTTTATGTVDVVIATSVADPSKSDQVVVNVESPSPILISPTAVTVGLGGHVDFTLSAQAGGQWFVDGIVFGNDTVGTIDGVGAYTAPYQIPTPTTAITVTQEFATNSASASVTVVSRFLSPETIQVDACVPQCAIDIPNAIVATDFNGDGFSDLATANTGTGTVSLLISADASHFAVPYRLQIGNPNSGEPQALVVADINQDSTVQDPRIDLVIADADPSGLAVRTRLGVGDGTFETERGTALPSNSNPLSMAVGHFDSHPHLDVAVANFVTNSVDILRGVGDGTFQVINTMTTGVSAPLGIAVSDFNGDDFEDLAVANSGNDTVSVFLSNADGTFATPQVVQLPGGGVSAIAAVKLSGDNYPDLVVTTTAPAGGLTAIINSGPNLGPFFDPRFIAPDPLVYPISTGTDPVAVAIGNFNRDSVSDVVVANRGDDTVTTYFFDAGGDVLVESETYTVGQTPQALAVGDFNGDGWDDVAVANSDDDTVSILRNRGGPTTTSP
jgi:hypothetical protein